MVRKHLITRLRNLTRPAHCPNFVQTRRHFSDAPASALPPPPPASNIHSKSSLNQTELNKFASIAHSCYVSFYFIFPLTFVFYFILCEIRWDAEGPFKPLHLMNPTRLAFIRSTLCRHFRKDPHCTRPFEGLKFMDVGCGGGVLSQPLVRMGATVTGIDAVEKNIKIAHLHAELDPITSSIDYCCTTAEKLVEEQRKFDAVIALEEIEHVADPADFCKSLSALTNSYLNN